MSRHVVVTALLDFGPGAGGGGVGGSESAASVAAYGRSPGRSCAREAFSGGE